MEIDFNILHPKKNIKIIDEKVMIMKRKAPKHATPKFMKEMQKKREKRHNLVQKYMKKLGKTYREASKHIKENNLF